MSKTKAPQEETQSGLEENLEHEWSSLIAALTPAREELPRVPQQDRSRQKRDRLLETAAKLFVERGYEETTSDDIAIAAGVSVGTFYKYFRNKRQVLLTLVLEQFQDVFSHVRLSQLDFSQGNHRQVIREAAGAAVNIGKSQLELRRVWREILTRDDELVAFHRLFRQRVLKELEESLRRAANQSSTWPDLDIEATAILIFTLFDSLTVRHYEALGEARLIESLTDMIYRTIFPIQL